MMHTPRRSHAAQHLHSSLRTGGQHSLRDDNEAVSAPLRSAIHDRQSRCTEPGGSYFPPVQDQWDMPDAEPCWHNAADLNSRNGLHHRQFAGSVDLNPYNENFNPSLFPQPQYLPSNMHSATRIAPRSSSQPSRRSDRWQGDERRPCTRQRIEALPSQQRVWTEPAFRGNADYQLFAEATFGLSPEHPQFQPVASAEFFESNLPSGDFEGETLRSVTAFRQLAQLPQTPDNVPSFPAASHSSPRQYLDSEINDDANDFTGSRRAMSLAIAGDDELPDYAQSQAEMYARARQQAVLRAQELQRRWRESHP